MHLDDPQQNTLFQGAEAAWEQGDWGKALRLALDCLRRGLARRRPLTPADRVLMERTADLAVPFGLTDGADHLFAALAEDCARAGLPFASDYAALKRVHLALCDGKLAEALQLLRRLEPRLGPLTAIPISPDGLPAWEARLHWPDARDSDRPVLLTRLYLSMGQWLAAEGHYGQAAVVLRRGSAHARPPAPDLACQASVPLRLALAGVQLEQGRLADLDEVLMPLEREMDARRHPGQFVEWLELAGKRDLLRGDFGGALERFARVVEVCRGGGFHRASLTAMLNQAQVLVYLNQVSVAEEWLAEAADLARRLPDPSARVRIAWLYRLARARGESLADGVAIAPTVTELWKGGGNGKAGEAEETVSPLDLPAAPNYLAFFEDRALAVQWALARDDTALASGLLGDLRQTFGGADSDLIHVRCAVLAGTVAYARGEYEAAAGVLAEACTALEARGLKPELWQARRFLGRCAVRLGRPPAECEALLRRTQALMTELAASLPPAQRAIYLLNKWTAEEQALAAEIDGLARAKAGLRQVPWYRRPLERWRLWRRLHRFLHQIDQGRRLLARRELAGTALAEAEAVAAPLWRRLWGHPWRRATISFLVLPDRVFIGRAGWLHLDFAVSPLTRLRVRELVARFHRDVSSDARSGTIEHAATELTAGLQLPALLAGLPRRIRALTVVPDDSLHGFPFAACRDNGRYLLEQYSVSVAFDRSAPLMGAGHTNPTRQRGKRSSLAGASGLCGDAPALTVAITRGTDTIPPLPETRAEAEEVARWLAGQGVQAECLADETADRATVLERWRQAGFVHVACHGLFRPDRPDASGLVLIPRPGEVEVLSLRDLAGLDARRLRHVTLSHCWSADNFVLPGRWIISLPEALWRAGAGSVLGCLWPIDDEVGRAFSRRFYEHLTDRPRDEALRAAQRECLTSALPGLAGRDTSHPFYWAGYQLHGDPRRLRL